MSYVNKGDLLSRIEMFDDEIKFHVAIPGYGLFPVTKVRYQFIGEGAVVLDIDPPPAPRRMGV